MCASIPHIKSLSEADQHECSHGEARLFGWVEEDELGLPLESRVGLNGSQAQYVRVPLADATLAKVGVDCNRGLSTAVECMAMGWV